MKILVIIPARGGSKGIPYKNIKKLNGKALITYTIEEARKVFEDENILVSTDDQRIKNVVESIGLEVPFLRPSHLASDTASTYDVLIHALEYKISQGFNPDVILLLQPTSPFRTAQHIEGALKLYDESLDMVVSVKQTNSNPYYILFEENKRGFLKKIKKKNFTRRQDVPSVYEYNGALYVINVSSLKQKEIGLFKKVIKYEMDEYSSHDIDTQLDWFIAEKIMENHLNEK